METSSWHIIRPSQLAEKLGVSRTTIYRMEKRGDLPPRIKMSNRAVGWRSDVIEEWLEERTSSDQELATN